MLVYAAQQCSENAAQQTDFIMASIIQRKGPKGKLVWQAQIRKSGFPPQIKTFKRKGDAEKWARKIEREIESGHWKDTHEASKIIFADALGRYIKTVTPQKRPKNSNNIYKEGNIEQQNA
ncbi:MAG: hypothetical protein WBD61_00410 [Desulfobulbales bacterium]